MITKQRVAELLKEGFGDGPLFFVEIDVSGANDIRVLVDNDNGVSIGDCVKVSRHLESSFDRDTEDFSLNVSSPGADQPLRFARQYMKNVGRDLVVKLADGRKLTGALTAANDAQIELKVREKRRIEGRKSKEWVEEVFALPYEEINEAKVVISFK
ncbi:MAG: ribosome assembly cofactor RimP [Flavobacteriales bacterium]